jgi:DNA primase
MFPLADARGRVLGFGARAMRDEQGAKYINTSENEIYHKGRQLFGIDRARQAAAKAERVVVVEGYTDVLALHQSGVREAVAIMGTALTEHQLSELARAAGTEGVVYLALDADSSGQQAMLRAAGIAENRDVELRVVQMPDGVDPAELVADEGSEAFLARLEGALSVLEFAVARVLAEADLGSPDGRDRALAQARVLVASAPAQSARRDHLVRMVADRLDLPVDYVVSAVERGPASEPSERGDPRAAQTISPPRIGDPPVAGNPGTAALESERVFLALCLAGGPAGRELLGELTPEHFTSAGMARARAHLLANFDDPLTSLNGEDREVAMLVAGIALLAEESRPTVVSTLRMGFLQLELRRIEREVRRARQDGDLARQGELASARQRVRQDMDAVMGEAM